MESNGASGECGDSKPYRAPNTYGSVDHPELFHNTDESIPKPELNHAHIRDNATRDTPTSLANQIVNACGADEATISFSEPVFSSSRKANSPVCPSSATGITVAEQRDTNGEGNINSNQETMQITNASTDILQATPADAKPAPGGGYSLDFRNTPPHEETSAVSAEGIPDVTESNGIRIKLENDELVPERQTCSAWEPVSHTIIHLHFTQYSCIMSRYCKHVNYTVCYRIS